MIALPGLLPNIFPPPRMFVVTLDELAAWLRVPQEWLRAEAEAGRIPHVDAGGELLFDRYAVESMLAARASEIPGADFTL